MNSNKNSRVLAVFAVALLLYADLVQASSCSAYSNGIELTGTMTITDELEGYNRYFFYNAPANGKVKISAVGGRDYPRVCVANAETSQTPNQYPAVCSVFNSTSVYLITTAAGCYSIGVVNAEYSVYTLTLSITDAYGDLPSDSAVLSDTELSCHGMGIGGFVESGLEIKQWLRTEVDVIGADRTMYFQKRANESVRLRVVPSFEGEDFYLNVQNAADVRKPSYSGRVLNTTFEDELNFTEYSAPACIAVTYSSSMQYFTRLALTFSLENRSNFTSDPETTFDPETASNPDKASADPDTASDPEKTTAPNSSSSKSSGMKLGLAIGLPVAAVVIAAIVVLRNRRQKINTSTSLLLTSSTPGELEVVGEQPYEETVTGKVIPSVAP